MQTSTRMSHTHTHTHTAEVDRRMSVRLDMEARIEELKRDAHEAVGLAEDHQREAEGAHAQAKSARIGEEEVGVETGVS